MARSPACRYPDIPDVLTRLTQCLEPVVPPPPLLPEAAGARDRS